MTSMMHVEEVAHLIYSGKSLIIYGRLELLRQIPEGNWIGCTPQHSETIEEVDAKREFVQVTELPEQLDISSIGTYPLAEEHHIPLLSPDDGTSYILPAPSSMHTENAPIVFNGQTGEELSGFAIVMHTHPSPHATTAEEDPL